MSINEIKITNLNTNVTRILTYAQNGKSKENIINQVRNGYFISTYISRAYGFVNQLFIFPAYLNHKVPYLSQLLYIEIPCLV